MPSFHYTVQANLINYTDEGEIDFIEIEEKFEDKEPINARSRAFSFYKSLVDVLLQAKDLEYTSDQQARMDLQSFVDSGTSTTAEVFGKKIEFSDSLGAGIGVFMVIDKPIDEEVFPDEEGEKILIHGIGNSLEFRDDPVDLIYGLEKELDYYNHFGYYTDNKVHKISFCNRDEWEEGFTEDEPADYIILETPFDFTGYDKPYWWGEPGEKDDRLIHNKTYEQIIRGGESNQVEFKPSLVFNFSTGKGGISVKHQIARTICGFLNSKGGFLFIGVRDSGEIQGLDPDFSLSHLSDAKDFFLQEFDQMISHFLGFTIQDNIQTGFYEIDEKLIFVVEVRPSRRRPIFLINQDEKEFYIRAEASTRQLRDIEEINNYCLERWG